MKLTEFVDEMYIDYMRSFDCSNSTYYFPVTVTQKCDAGIYHEISDVTSFFPTY